MVLLCVSPADRVSWGMEHYAGPATKILGGFVSFFLIFRTNQAFNRYWKSNRCLKEIQVVARELQQQFVSYMKGGQMADREAKPQEYEDWEAYATSAKTD